MKKIIILGSKGLLGAAILRRFSKDLRYVRGFDRTQIDLFHPEQVMELAAMDFDILINAAAIVNMEFCENNGLYATQVNAYAPANMAMICRDKGAKFIHFSSNYVFNGEKRTPYLEDDPVSPVSAYGMTKVQSERLVLSIWPDSLIIRTSWLFGPDKPTMVDKMLHDLECLMRVKVVSDRFAVPTYTESIALFLPLLFEQKGIFHMVNSGSCSLHEYISVAAEYAGCGGHTVKACLSSELPPGAPRPTYTVLDNTKFQNAAGRHIADWQVSLTQYVKFNRFENRCRC